jgi:hypothetical protein
MNPLSNKERGKERNCRERWPIRTGELRMRKFTEHCAGSNYVL